MKAPFIWFGGKRRVAPQVWDARRAVVRGLVPRGVRRSVPGSGHGSPGARGSVDARRGRLVTEYGEPVGDRYKRLGAGSESTDVGLYVRFEPGFGLTVHIGIRCETRWEVKDFDELALSIGGWERLCELVDEWRARATSPTLPGQAE